MSGSNSGAPGATGYVVSDLINMALRQIGVGAMGTTASAADLMDGVMHLNMLLAQWQRKRWLVPNLVDRAFPSRGVSTYSVGPGGDLNVIGRPDKIEAAYARLLGRPSLNGDFARVDFLSTDFDVTDNGLDPVGAYDQPDPTPAFYFDGGEPASQTLGAPPMPIDYPLEIIQSYEDYAGLGLKALRSWPNYCYYNPEFPKGLFYPWPIPQGNIWEFHLIFKEPLPANLSASSPINLPPEYWDAIMWTLAARMAPSYGQEASPTVVANAKAALDTIRTANTQIPTLGMPAILNPVNNPFYWPGLEIQRL